MSGCPRAAGRTWRVFPVGAGPAWRGSAARGGAGQGRALPVSARVALTGRCGITCWKVLLLCPLSWLGGDV